MSQHHPLYLDEVGRAHDAFYLHLPLQIFRSLTRSWRWTRRTRNERLARWSLFDKDIWGTEGTWVIGLVSRTTTTVWLQPVTERSSVSLLTPMLRRVERGTTIVSDALAAYREISFHGYFMGMTTHLSIKRGKAFAGKRGTRKKERRRSKYTSIPSKRRGDSSENTSIDIT